MPLDISLCSSAVCTLLGLGRYAVALSYIWKPCFYFSENMNKNNQTLQYKYNTVEDIFFFKKSSSSPPPTPILSLTLLSFHLRLKNDPQPILSTPLHSPIFSNKYFRNTHTADTGCNGSDDSRK